MKKCQVDFQGPAVNWASKGPDSGLRESPAEVAPICVSEHLDLGKDVVVFDALDLNPGVLLLLSYMSWLLRKIIISSSSVLSSSKQVADFDF